VAADHGVEIPQPIAEAMLDHARSELPNEACGLLSGSLADGRAVSFHPARNSEASPLRYNVHPDDLVRIMFEIDEAESDLVAIFHSHTRSPAIPSSTDRRAAQYPDPFYVVATLANPKADAQQALRAWRIHGGQMFEVPLRVTPTGR
jgi:proteasome lid subunit RPN8/RPN11